MIADQRLDVKFVPLSDVMVSGRPNREIQAVRASMQDSAVASLMGKASGHLVVRSIAVNIYL